MDIVVHVHRNVLVVDSRLIAQDLGIKHKNFLETLNKYLSEIEEDWGRVAFETRVVKLPQGGSYKETWALLSEEQATLLMTYSRNTKRVRQCKRNLVKAFSHAKKGQPSVTSQPPIANAELSAIVKELENLIISIRSHGRTIHTGSHQPVDPILFKSLHTLSHNQLSVINATIEQLELLKRLAEMGNSEEATAPTSQQTINYLFSSPPPTDNPADKAEDKETTSPTAETEETEDKEDKTKQLTNINVKIPLSQRQWLADTARQVRRNNTKPVPPAERVYPQHLVSIAIQLLQKSHIDIEAAHSIRLEQNEPLATINIKITRQQQELLTATSKTIRDNNQQPSCPHERIYPQHLIAIAVEQLQNAKVRWYRVENVDQIQKRLTTPFHLHLV